jgi:hypothetical protein
VNGELQRTVATEAGKRRQWIITWNRHAIKLTLSWKWPVRCAKGNFHPKKPVSIRKRLCPAGNGAPNHERNAEMRKIMDCDCWVEKIQHWLGMSSLPWSRRKAVRALKPYLKRNDCVSRSPSLCVSRSHNIFDFLRSLDHSAKFAGNIQILRFDAFRFLSKLSVIHSTVI